MTMSTSHIHATHSIAQSVNPIVFCWLPPSMRLLAAPEDEEEDDEEDISSNVPPPSLPSEPPLPPFFDPAAAVEDGELMAVESAMLRGGVSV